MPLSSPQPRFSVRSFPFRTSAACFWTPGSFQWRMIEDACDPKDLPNTQEKLSARASRLLSFFRASPKATQNRVIESMCKMHLPFGLFVQRLSCLA